MLVQGMAWLEIRQKARIEIWLRSSASASDGDGKAFACKTTARGLDRDSRSAGCRLSRQRARVDRRADYFLRGSDWSYD